MKQLECVWKSDLYSCDIVGSIYGGVNMTVYRIRQGRTPKPILHRYCKSEFEAMMEIEQYMPDATWKERVQ